MAVKQLLSGNEAIALAALDARVAFGAGYPGTPSSEILDEFANLGGKAQWSPNEKTALENAIGGAFGQVRTLATMKHVGLNVAADPLFTIAYSGTPGGLVIITADDPGMASSQNEQDNRRYAAAAGVPMFEPSDSQEAYDFLFKAFELSEKFHQPVLYRLTTRVCHSKSLVARRENPVEVAPAAYTKDVKSNVMIPAYARIAHKNLRKKLADIAALSDSCNEYTKELVKGDELGIITSGISYHHCREAAPEASILKLTLSYPFPAEKLKKFAAKVKRCVVVEEGDPILFEACKAMGLDVEGKEEMYRFGELNVERVRRILANDTSAEPVPAPGKPPQLCVGCPHRKSYEALKALNCIVTGDIGCYTLGVLPPFEAVDTCVCMGASVTTGLGLRRVLPEAEARRVVSVLGDSTFWHTGINGIVDMVYNKPATGHVVMVLDNSITAMTGLQEHPGTGRKLDHTPAEKKLVIEDTVRAMGVDNVDIIDPLTEQDKLQKVLAERLASNDTTVIIARRPCILGAVKAKSYEEKNQAAEK